MRERKRGMGLGQREREGKRIVSERERETGKVREMGRKGER